jgi:hypothetical protein
MNQLRYPPRQSSLAGLNHWQMLSFEEKLDEFRELTASPYWSLLPEDIKLRIRSLLDC